MGLFSHAKNAKTPSLYELILAALDENGQLPGDFSLPDDTPEGQLRYAAGAMDGIGVFHMAGQDSTEPAEHVAGLLLKACQKGLSDKIRETLAAYLKEHHVLGIVDPLIEQIRGGGTGITPRDLYAVGYGLMAEAADAESVKLGIAMTGLLDIERNEDCCKAILTLGKCDEFTLYSLVAVSGWEDGNQCILQLAREARGWGKVHAVERLEPQTPEIREWILTDGCENGVLNSYLGLTCAEKCGLLTYLERESLSAMQLRGAGIILSAMLDEGPTAGISVYGDAESAVGHYLRHVQNSNSLETLSVVLELRTWLEDCELPARDSLLALCRSIAEKPQWTEMVLTALRPGDNAVLWRAVCISEQLGLDITEPLFRLAEQAPLEYSAYVRNICASPEYGAKLIRLYEQALPIEEIATGMGNLMGLGPKFKAHGCLDMALQELGRFPGQGIRLVKAGLNSPVVRNRNMALKALEAWTADGAALEKFDPALRPLLEKTLSEEVNDTTREALEKLL